MTGKNMKKLFVTGGAGYLGSALIPELLKRRYHVTVLDNFAHGEESLALLQEEPNFTLVRGDVRDPILTASLVKKADIIIPLAGIVGAPACDREPEAATHINLECIRQLM